MSATTSQRKDFSPLTRERIEQWLFYLETANPNADASEFFNGDVKQLCDMALSSLSGPSESARIDLSLFINAADISAADVPHIVVEKLQRALDAANASMVLIPNKE